jgi:hypothetical protein
VNDWEAGWGGDVEQPAAIGTAAIAMPHRNSVDVNHLTWVVSMSTSPRVNGGAVWDRHLSSTHPPRITHSALTTAPVRPGFNVGAQKIDDYATGARCIARFPTSHQPQTSAGQSALIAGTSAGFE